MDEFGYDSTVASDGTISFTGLSTSELEHAIEQCTEEIPYMPTESEILEIYALELQNAACLEALGYRIAPAPDEATYLTTHNTADWWMPILSVTEAERARAAAECPPPTGNH